MTRWTVAQLQKTDWFAPLLEQIQGELDRLSDERQDARPDLQKERLQLGEQIQGWLLSLAKPDLSPTARSVIEKEMEGPCSANRKSTGS